MDIKGKNLENNGTIAARFNKIYVEKLDNKKDILAEKTLDISTFGNILSQIILLRMMVITIMGLFKVKELRTLRLDSLISTQLLINYRRLEKN
ncbi:Uncharacterised protein [Rodentibacter pneumotropicus]|uniref:Uncharacterized protein n=1 Tax=Rodentibacter pneumotropicus TaxID=758 RepID=A0A3S4XW73_9PAST|nr:Uncharacterised protein [Rodentibacter pneumotropicus]